MGQRGRKYKEDVPADFVIEKINTMPINKLMPVAKIVCGTDYAVSHYQNKNHPKFYHNQEAFRKAMRRCFAIGAFEHRSTIIDRLHLKEEYAVSQISKYSKIIEGHAEEIQKEVNKEFEHCKECEYYGKQSKKLRVHYSEWRGQEICKSVHRSNH